jgi:hypothetical protein
VVQPSIVKTDEFSGRGIAAFSVRGCWETLPELSKVIVVQPCDFCTPAAIFSPLEDETLWCGAATAHSQPFMFIALSETA